MLLLILYKRRDDPSQFKIAISINTDENNAHDLRTWEEFHSQCSFNAIKFIIKMRKNKLLMISKNIEAYRVKLEPFKNLEDYKNIIRI